MNEILYDLIDRLEMSGLDREEACALLAAFITEHIMFMDNLNNGLFWRS